MANIMVKPGEQIKPQIDIEGAVALAERLYGIKVDSAIELNGYDDKNYHLKVTQPPKNKFIENLWEHGYVLKIMNSSDSKKLDIVMAHCELMQYLDANGIKTPQPQKNIDGKLFCLETFPKDPTQEESPQHVIRLLTYQNGTLLKDIPCSFELDFRVGKFTGQLDLILEKFTNNACKDYSSLWMLKNVGNVRDYINVIQYNRYAILVVDVIETFEDRVLPYFQLLKQGVIHGDIHEQNLLCEKDSEGEWQISAVLDLGDCHHSAYIFELGQAMTYMMMQSETLETGRYVAAGYGAVFHLLPHERSLLKVIISARLCQSLVLGRFNHYLHPDNEYLLSTQKTGWKMLSFLWAQDEDYLEQLWFTDVEVDSLRASFSHVRRTSYESISL